MICAVNNGEITVLGERTSARVSSREGEDADTRSVCVASVSVSP